MADLLITNEQAYFFHHDVPFWQYGHAIFSTAADFFIPKVAERWSKVEL